MGQVCENCGWRENPTNNSGRGCIFTNNKGKAWGHGNYNQPCNNYVTDTTLRRHLIELINIEKSKERQA